ncbi:ubiquinone biosynthesis O-methyltransferase, mitochondrial isoform 2-T2 [Macrochelys suwanniensis]
MWGCGGLSRAARALVAPRGRSSGPGPPGRRLWAAAGDHYGQAFQRGPGGFSENYSWKMQLTSNSTRFVCLTEMKSSIDNLLNMSSDHQLGSPLSGVKILDVGCGGGLLSEPLGRLGASVTGIDPLEDNIRTAEQHKSFDPVLAKRIQYKPCSLEDIVEEATETFDVIVASEVVEHVADLETFIKYCYQVLKPEGSLFITTINKTQLSYILGIVVAERIMGIVPEGTHDWEKFISPEELECLLDSNGFLVKTVNGMSYNPLSGSWSWTESTSINYAVYAVKSRVKEQSSSREPPSETDKEEHLAEASASTTV